ncbi:uncharacterized protein [Macrobrachium rosenbergii]|uniref:uncharacterized protein n=1 Tax=Macrobrachium rosenbergii TaxID=79674 RepID=UPI0034D5C320
MPPKRKMRDDWLANEDFSPWLSRVEGDPEKALCNICNKQFNAELSTIKRHKTRKAHITNEEHWLQNREELRDHRDDQPENLHINKGVALATILMVYFIAERNLPFTIADHLVELCKVIFPDSVIARGSCLKKTKCTEITKALGKCVTNELVGKLKTHKFSVVIDESIDVSTTKCLTVIVKYYDFEASMLKTGTLELLNLYDNDTMCWINGGPFT